ncbi:solute carrier family 43 member 3 isoform X2 [Numida meleagris]|uniref:solute carrier family 43 member 3 isoform X2 n=1 Tax=Numida meleagris TaxID=8996 RepID=UPI000B3DA2AD|nr:solute carrier family 43 member 3 isoform X2 [Numida meleagris]
MTLAPVAASLVPWVMLVGCAGVPTSVPVHPEPVLRFPGRCQCPHEGVSACLALFQVPWGYVIVPRECVPLCPRCVPRCLVRCRCMCQVPGGVSLSPGAVPMALATVPALPGLCHHSVGCAAFPAVHQLRVPCPPGSRSGRLQVHRTGCCGEIRRWYWGEGAVLCLSRASSPGASPVIPAGVHGAAVCLGHPTPGSSLGSKLCCCSNTGVQEQQSPVPGSMAGGAGRAKKLGTLLSGLLECGAFCGIIFGWASLVYVLKNLNYFKEWCESSANPNGTLYPDCSGQDEQFSLVFTIGSFMNNFVTLPMGYVFDRFGTAVARLIAISLYTCGTLLVAFSTPDLALLLFPAMSMLSVGGILLILTNMQVGNLFGKYRSIIITLYNGAFDSSSAIFLIIKVLHEHGLSLRAMFLFMAACSAWHLLRTIFLMPRMHIPYPLPPAYNYGLACPGHSQSYRTYEEKRPPEDNGPEEVPLEPSAPKGNAAVEPFWPCVFSWLFAWHVVWLSVMQLRHYLFIGTLNPLLNHLAFGNEHLVSTYTNAFAFTQLCGVICAPWNGLILDRHKRSKAHRAEGAQGALADLRASVLSLVLTVTQCVLFSVCAAVPVLPVQFATFVLQVISRSFLYGGNAAFLAIAFPPQHFGKLYGLAMALSALVALLQYPCIALVRGALQGDPFYMNVGLIAVVLLAYVSPVVVARECRRRAKKLKAAASPLETSTSAETPAQTPH